MKLFFNWQRPLILNKKFVYRAYHALDVNMKVNYQRPIKTQLKIAFRITVASAFFVVLLFNNPAFAGALPVRKGKLRLAVSSTYFIAYSYWDKNGKLISFPLNGHFSALGLVALAEYGLSKRWTAVAQLPYNYVQQSFTNGKISASGFGDAEAGLRYYLANINFKYFFAVQGSVVAPLYNTPLLGYRSLGDDFKLSAFETGNMGSHSYYTTAEVGVTQYFDKIGPLQYKYSGAIGYVLDKHDQIALGVGGTISHSINKSFSADLIQNRDFYFHLVSINYGYTVNRNMSLFAGVSQLYAGQNTGKGTDISLSVNIRY